MNYDQKILVIRFSSIGDIVLSTSPLRTIRKVYPNAQITFLTLDNFASLLEYHPDIDILLSINKRYTFKELLGFCKYLKQKRYEIIFDLHGSLRSNIVIYNNSAKIYQLKKPRLKRLALFYFHHNDFGPRFSTIKMYHDTLKPILKQNIEIPPTKLKISRYETERAQRMLLGKGVFDKYIAVIPVASWKQKQWPATKYIETLRQLEMPAVLLGTNKDTICFDIEKGLKSAINLAGKTSLRDALAIIANADKIIGSDTGLIHAAEALGKPVSMILGPTSSETGGGVSLPDSIQIEKELWCRPCSQNGKMPCYRNTQVCLESINVQDIMKSLNRN